MINGPILLIGAGGHAKSLLSLVKLLKLELIAVCDPALESGECWNGIPVVEEDGLFDYVKKQDIGLINGIGYLGIGSKRSEIFNKYKQSGYSFPILIHPHAFVATESMLGRGAQIMAGAVIQPSCIIGDNTIINTGSSVDHDCSVGKNVHIAPGSTICGDVIIGDDCFLGAGCIVSNGITVPPRSIIGAGAVVMQNYEMACTLAGIPAKPIK
jgi:UDP-perosamine 4-acetyltransferase